MRITTVLFSVASFLGASAFSQTSCPIPTTSNTILGGSGPDILSGASANDLMIGFASDDYLRGCTGDDYIQGLDGSDTLVGNQGNDTLDGGTGDDILRGGQNDDCLLGGDGNDTFYGGLGNDLMLGGMGDDCYNIDNVGLAAAASGVDVINDPFGANTVNFRGLQPVSATIVGADLVLNLGSGSTVTLVGFSTANYSVVGFPTPAVATITNSGPLGPTTICVTGLTGGVATASLKVNGIEVLPALLTLAAVPNSCIFVTVGPTPGSFCLNLCFDLTPYLVEFTITTQFGECIDAELAPLTACP